MRGELFLSDGTVLPPKGRYDLQADQTVTLRIPGGGGYGSPLDRDPEKVLEDVRQQRVSVDAARERYGVVIDSDNWQVDSEGTEALRAEMRAENSGR
jgi:N-methylhydantoinase B